jgi:hypothetical protein
MVWIGTQRPLAEFRAEVEPDPETGYHRIERAKEGDPVLGRFTSPFVCRFGSHEGCGCGFNSGTMTWEGMTSIAEVVSLLGALTDDERLEFDEEQRSRHLIRQAIEAAALDGDVEVFACWAGDEIEPALATLEVDPEHFDSLLEPFDERTVYVVRRRV